MGERTPRTSSVVAGLVRASLVTSMQYRLDFVLDTASGFLRTLAALGPIALLLGVRDDVLGWSRIDILAVMGLYLVLHAALAALIEPNLGEIVESIRTGKLDFLLLKPADAQLMASIRKVHLAPLVDVPVGGALLGYAIWQSPPGSPLDLVVAAVLALSGAAAIYGLWLLAICTSFFFVKVDNLRYLLWAAVDAGRWPLPVFARWVQWALIVLVPIGIVTTFPVQALRGEWTAGTVIVGVLVGIGFVLGSRLAWKAALGKYTSASS